MLRNITYTRAKSSSDIAREMGITRQAVSQSLKRAITKVYNGLQTEGITDSPAKTLIFMREWFGIEDEDDIKQFITLLPPKIRREVKEDVANFKFGDD